MKRRKGPTPSRAPKPLPPLLAQACKLCGAFWPARRCEACKKALPTCGWCGELVEAAIRRWQGLVPEEEPSG